MQQIAESRPAEIAKLIDISRCIGCKACQVACMEWNDVRDEVGSNKGVYDNPPDLSANSWTVMRYAEVEVDGRLEWLFRKDGCMHCAEPGCAKACMTPGAIVRHASGIVEFQADYCIGCGFCVTGCPFSIPRLSPETGKARKCTLCADRVAEGLEPACVKTCPTGALVFGAKQEMVSHAQERLADLKQRGYDNAGLYDPSGVGGTHVMYLLPHADQPGLYAGLPPAPAISPAVKRWVPLHRLMAAVVLLLLLPSGLALFDPALAWLASPLGAEATVRSWHSYIGIGVLAVLAAQGQRFAEHFELLDGGTSWARQAREVLAARRRKPGFGAYNAFQLALFKTVWLCAPLLWLVGTLSGYMEPTPRPPGSIAVAATAHKVLACLLIATIFTHALSAKIGKRWLRARLKKEMT